MIKLYAIFHLPTGEIERITNGRGANLTTQRPQYLQIRLDNEIKYTKRRLEGFKEDTPNECWTQENIDDAIIKTQAKLDILNQCEVRELNYTMGAE